MQFAKYLVIATQHLEVAILFPATVSHDQAVNNEHLARTGSRLLSAGFFSLREDGSVQVHAELSSQSTGLDPRPEQDAQAIENTLLLTGLRSSIPVPIKHAPRARRQPVAA